MKEILKKFGNGYLYKIRRFKSLFVFEKWHNMRATDIM